MQVLGSALDAPPAKQIDAALQTLKELGATDEAQRLTPLGQKLCQLHIEPRLGKMLVFGTILRCIDPVLTIAARSLCGSGHSAACARVCTTGGGG